MDQSQSRSIRYAVSALFGFALLLLLAWLFLREPPPAPDQSARLASVSSSVSPPAPIHIPVEETPREAPTNQVAESATTNAAVFYQQAFALYDALTKDEKDLVTKGLATNDAALVAGLCGKIQPICDLLHQAAATSNCDWGVELPITPDTRLPYLMPCRNIARVVVWSVANCRANDPAAAVDELLATSRLGQQASSPPILIGCMVDLAIQNLVATSIAENASRLTHADATPLIDRFTNANYDDLVRRAIELEADVHARMVDQLAAKPPNDAVHELLNGMNESSVSQLQAMGPAQTFAKMRQAIELEQQYAQALGLPEPEYRAWIAARDEAGQTNPFVAEFVTSLEKAVDRIQFFTVNAAVAAAGLAVMQDGPDSLGSYPDPATGQPFVYTRTDDGFTLESGFRFKDKTVQLSFK